MSGHTLGVAGLADATYLTLIDQREVRWRDHAHFFEEAAKILRRLLVDDAVALRCGGVKQNTIEQALAKLAAIDKGQALEVELKFFGGLTSEEIAEILPGSDDAVERD